jgi:hypothetical protein
MLAKVSSLLAKEKSRNPPKADILPWEGTIVPMKFTPI